jgi:hypothetical protein
MSPSIVLDGVSQLDYIERFFYSMFGTQKLEVPLIENIFFVRAAYANSIVSDAEGSLRKQVSQTKNSFGK